MPDRGDSTVHPWLVVDTYGEKTPVGCWTEAAARALPARITAPYERGRWQPMTAEQYASTSTQETETP